MSYILHSWTELQLALAAQYPNCANLAPAFLNRTYCSVTRDWVEKQFAPYMHQYLTARGQLTWAKRGNQCEHFAIRAALEAVELFRLSRDPAIPEDAESLAVAWAKYNRADGQGWHEVNFWFVGGLWQPWEPQQQAFFDLQPTESASLQQFVAP